MGFPKHLVVRVASKIQDDKKVSQHELIMLLDFPLIYFHLFVCLFLDH